MGTDRHDLAKLAVPFPDAFIGHTPAAGGRRGDPYVAHHVVNQWLLGILGPFDFELVQVIRGDVAAVPGDPNARSERWRQGTPALHDVIVGAVYRLTAVIDGRRTVIEEAGDVEDPHNWRHDGARLKQAASDAIKRCAMRLGLGLHLWSQEHYVLDERLARPKAQQQQQQQDGETSEGDGERANGRTGKAAEPATTRAPSDPTPAGAVERPESSDREAPAPAPAGTTPDPDPADPARQAPAGAASLAPAGPVESGDGADPERTIADLKALCDRKHTHLGVLLVEVRKAARNGELPDAFQTIKSFDTLDAEGIAAVLAWAEPSDDLADLVHPEGVGAS